MSQRLKQYLNDVFDGKNMVIVEISQDSNLQMRYQSMVKNLKITKQSLAHCLKEIGTVLLKDPMNNGYIVSLLLFSMELDSYHSLHSSSWYRRDILVEILHDLFLCYDIQPINVDKHANSNLFWSYSFIILFVYMTMLILNI